MGKSVVRVLLVEDDTAYAGLLTGMLNDSDASFKLTHVPRLEEALNLLDNISFDIVLLGLVLQDSSGLAGVKKIQSRGTGIPLVILTGTDDDNLSLQTLQNGAADYILKTQITPYTLVRSLRYAIERTRSQHEREITIEFLHIVNECTGLQELLKAVTTFFQKYSGCQAVAIRLRKGDDYPYAGAIGFPEDFVNMENSLCSLDTAGEKARDNNGNPILECMCGNVIRGHFDPAMPFFTARGSFCTNSTTKLMASEMRNAERVMGNAERGTGNAERGTGTAERGTGNTEQGTGSNQEEVKNVIPNSPPLPHSSNFPSSPFPVPPLLACMCNRCNREGYESTALIPLHTGKERFGLLQLNDRRKCVFTPELIGLLERLADQFSVGLAKFLAKDALKTAYDETLNEKKRLSATMEALRENEERYHNLILMSPDAIFINNENKITYANRAAISLFGASTAEEFLGKSPFSLYHPDYHPMLRKRIRMLMEGNSVPLIETKALRLDGTAMNVEVVASPFLEKGARFVQVIVRNISERRKAERELKTHEEILRLFVKHAPAAVAMFDNNMRYLVYSDRWLTDYGLTHENLIGRSHYEVFPEIDERWKALHRRGLNGVAEKNDNDYFIRKDGKTEWLRWEIIPWHSVDGHVGGIILFSELITERKKMHEIVERYHLISRYARDSMLMIEFDGKIVEANEAAVALYGYSHEELLDMNILQLHRQEERETARRLMIQAKLGDLLFEAVLLRKDGTDIPVEINSRIILIEGKQMFLSVARDITVRKKRDMELQMLNRTLTAQSQSNQAMMRANNESDYINEVCGIILKACGHFMVWIGFAEDDAGKSIRPVACKGFDEGYIETMKITWADTEHGHGPTGTAIRTGKPKLCRSTLTDPSFNLWREQAIKRGYASIIAFPLISDGKPFGAITIYSKNRDLFTDDEVQLLSELANDLSYGITAIRLRSALQKTEQTAHAILNAITESICLLDSQGRILAANSIAADRLGINIAEISERNYFDFLPPHIAELRRSQAEKVFKSGKPFRFEDEPTGTFLDHHFYPVKDEKKNITGLAIFSSDITERKLTEAALQKSETQLRGTLESTDNGILAIDNNGKVLQVNRRFTELWGIPQHIMQHGHDDILLDFVSEQLIAPSAFLKKVKSLYEADTMDMDILAFKDGRTYERYSSAMFMEGVRIGRVWAFRDITDRKKAEEILKRDRETLLKLVKERSSELIEIQTELERSKRLTDIGTLAATVAHELRNPLAAINLAAAVIKRKNTDNMIERQLERIDNTINESYQIIDNLLYYSRIRSPQYKSLSLHTIIEECVETVLDTNKRKGILVSKHMESIKALTTSADPLQIREVFINVLNNAADAVPEHCGNIVVKTSVFRKLIKINIMDNGHGTAGKDLKKAFDPFFTTKSKGTGLGLTICKQIVKMHSGSISIKNIKGKGTAVIITLPKEAP
jgi:PAS domain S-box-containing protein